MRVSPVNNNYGQNKVNFGRFAKGDENARNVVRETLTADDKDTQLLYNSWFKRIEDDENFIAYTDKKSGKVKGKFDNEFVKENAKDNSTYAHRFITSGIEGLKRRGNLDDLSIMKNLRMIANHLSDFQEALKGVNLADSCRSKNPYGDARDEERVREDFLNNLAD